MHFSRLLDFPAWGLALQMAGAVCLAGFIIAAWLSLFLRHDLTRARLLVAEGVLACLGIMTAATLLRTISLRTWEQILIFTLTLSLRLLLKRLFVWEKKRLMAPRTR